VAHHTLLQKGEVGLSISFRSHIDLLPTFIFTKTKNAKTKQNRLHPTSPSISWNDVWNYWNDNGMVDMMTKQKQARKNKPKCEYCNCEINLLKTSNHIIGCNLEAVAGVLRYRGEDKIANELDKLASRIK